MIGRKTTLAMLDERGDTAGLLKALEPAKRDLVDALDGTLIDRGASRRREAAERLASHPGEAVDAGLDGALSDGSTSVRSAAILSLGQRDTEVEVARLVDAAFGARDEGAAALAGFNAARPDHAEALLAAYATSDVDSARTFALTWGSGIAEDLEADARARVIELAVPRAAAGDDRAWQVLAIDRKAAVRALAHLVDDGSDRREAIELLGRLRDATAVAPLVLLLDDDDPELRESAARALGVVKHPKSVDALLKATLDDEYAVRDAAMTALDGFGSAGTVWGMASMGRAVLSDALPGDSPAEPHQIGPPEIRPAAPDEASPHTSAWRRRRRHRSR